MKTAETDFASKVQAALDAKTKPVGSLGQIEALAARIAHIQKTLTPVAETCQLPLFAGDHGLAHESVSAFPQDVTRQMVQNFLTGGAAANVFARTLDIDVQVVDCGVAGEPIKHEALISRRVGAGTANAIAGPAMTKPQLDEAVANGKAIGAEGDHHAVCFGEMGIGNTSSASLLAAKLLGLPVEHLTGRGTGLQGDGLNRKRDLLVKASSRTADTLPVDVALAEYGGFEIATMAGAMVGAAGAGKIVLVDGFIATVAALCAKHLSPGCEEHFVFAHRSAEGAHIIVLQALGATPILALDMRLGEGTGGLLAWPLVKAAAAMLTEMASFDTAGVSGPA